MEITARRSTTVKMYSIAVGTIMWILSLLDVLLVFMVWFGPNKSAELPMIAITVSLLFALPSLRNTLPGVPPLGCTLDVVSFFWAIGTKLPYFIFIFSPKYIICS